MIFQLDFCGCDETLTKTDLEKERSHFNVQVTVHHPGKLRQGLKQRPWTNSADWLVPSGLLNHPFYIGQAHLPKDGTTHHQLAMKKMPHRHTHGPV